MNFRALRFLHMVARLHVRAVGLRVGSCTVWHPRMGVHRGRVYAGGCRYGRVKAEPGPVHTVWVVGRRKWVADVA